jgi:hypothetical protein
LRHEAWPIPKRLHFGKPRHETNGNSSFSNVSWVEELNELADQLRMPTLKHGITRATAAGREAISAISIPGCTITYTEIFALTSSSLQLP